MLSSLLIAVVVVDAQPKAGTPPAGAGSAAAGSAAGPAPAPAPTPTADLAAVKPEEMPTSVRMRRSIRASFSGSFAPTLFANDDRMMGSGDDDVLYAFGGDDKIIGGKGADAIFGGSDDDALAGGGSDDSVSGQGGDDVIDGEKGNDTLLGGTGQNSFVFDTALDAATNVDTVGDFIIGSDPVRACRNRSSSNRRHRTSQRKQVRRRVGCQRR